MLAGGWIVAGILADLDLLLVYGADDESWDEHDPPGWDHFEVGMGDLQILVIKIRKTQA